MEKQNSEYSTTAFSICIPVYNYSIVNTVNELHRQALQTGSPFEIIVMDDCSTSYQNENRTVSSLPYVELIELKVNIGRSAIRNALASRAKYPYLIFMDCDVLISNSSYIINYLNEIPAEVVIGGCNYLNIPPAEPAQLLRWTYGISREKRKAAVRNKEPYRSFTAFNCMMNKKLFTQIRFNEQLAGYGHEDTLFGWELKRRNITVRHIENSIIHLSLDDSLLYISKWENSLCNLWQIYQNIDEKEQFVSENKLLQYFLLMKRYRLLKLFDTFAKLFKSAIRKNLVSKHPNMKLFDIYKLIVMNEYVNSIVN